MGFGEIGFVFVSFSLSKNFILMCYNNFFRIYLFLMCMCISVCVWHAFAGANTEEGIRFSET